MIKLKIQVKNELLLFLFGKIYATELDLAVTI